MDFELTPDQLLLRDTLQRFAGGEYGFERRRELLAAEWGCDAAVWRALAGQGMLGIGLPEAHGGFGGAVEVMLMMEQIGRSLMLEPFLSTVVLAGGLIADQGSEAQQAMLLPRIIAGEHRIGLGHHEPGARYALDYVQTAARRHDGGYEVSGHKCVVLDGAVADLLLVSARDEAAGDVSLFLIDPEQPGVHRLRYRTQDGRSAADFDFRAVHVPADRLLGAPGRALEALERAIDRALAALCAEAVGAMEALNETTLEYLKSRRQFGQPIGRFQVLQHRMADMFLMAVQARSMSLLATGRCEERDSRERRRAISAAKAFVGRAARFVGQQAVQLHGGMGLTAELPVAHYFKRLTMINATFGDVDHHTAVLSDMILAETARGE